MSTWRLVIRSLVYHWRMNASVAMGVAAATAVLVGALLVGDSVRGSLRHLVLDRLGRIDDMILADRFFRSDLAGEVERSLDDERISAVGAVMIPSGSVERLGPGQQPRSSGVLLIGCDESFWELGSRAGRPKRLPADGEAVINAPLAKDLGIRAEQLGGDDAPRLVVRFPKSNEVPADSPLGKKSGRIRSVAQLKIVDIIPAEGLGRFALRSSQALPRNIYLPRSVLQSALEQDEKINALFIAGPALEQPPNPMVSERLRERFDPSLEDLGFRLKTVRRPQVDSDADGPLAYHYFSLMTDRMLLSRDVAIAAERAFGQHAGQPVLTYLANALENLDASSPDAPDGIPFSLITAIDFADLMAARPDGGESPISALTDDEIVLVDWAAERLRAEPGHRIRVTYYEPETPHGQFAERNHVFTLKSIARLGVPDSPYDRQADAIYQSDPRRILNDPDMTPEVPGFTDQESIESDETPFPINRKIGLEDDRYWSRYRATPKAYVSLSIGRRLWGSRFGEATTFRVPASPAITADSLRADFQRELKSLGYEQLGFQIIDVKQAGLDAASGTTPFDMLFLGLSLFVIVAALMLVSLLFRLGIEQRARQVGVMLAVGIPRSLAGKALAMEGALVATAGASVGIGIGLAYAKLMLVALRTIWLGAVVTPFLEFHWTWTSLLIGYGAGVTVSVATIALSIWRVARSSPSGLLAGQATDGASRGAHGSGRTAPFVAAGLMGLALILAIVAATVDLGTEATAGSFVGAGAAVLSAALIIVWTALRRRPRGSDALAGKLPITRLSIRSAARNPGRSTLTMGLIATASFLIVAMSSFRLDPGRAGAGGFALVGQSADAIFTDFNDPAAVSELDLGSAADWDGVDVYSLRLEPGDDASCNNLYQATHPRILGVPPSMVDHFDSPDAPAFAWAGSAATGDAEHVNPWRLLGARSPSAGDAVPVVIDKNTAMYSLHLGTAIGEEFVIEYGGRPIRFRVVGHLSNSILQGSLVIGEADFVKYFPQIEGYRYFLISSPEEEVQSIARAFEGALGDSGFDATRTDSILAGLMAVQNTYLSTFQSLGALGLLLGTFGLATVQMRNVMERRGELALLRAAGFPGLRLAQIVLLENVFLLLGGLAVGVFSATVAVLPHVFLGGASAPWRQLAAMLGTVLVVGVLTSLAGVRAVLHAPLVPALRSE